VPPGKPDAANEIIAPAHNGLLLPTVGIAGTGLTIAATLLATLVHPLTVTLADYIPEPDRVLFIMEGLCKVEKNPFGPVHA